PVGVFLEPTSGNDGIFCGSNVVIIAINSFDESRGIFILIIQENAFFNDFGIALNTFEVLQFFYLCRVEIEYFSPGRKDFEIRVNVVGKLKTESAESRKSGENDKQGQCAGKNSYSRNDRNDIDGVVFAFRNQVTLGDVIREVHLRLFAFIQ